MTVFQKGSAEIKSRMVGLWGQPASLLVVVEPRWTSSIADNLTWSEHIPLSSQANHLLLECI